MRSRSVEGWMKNRRKRERVEKVREIGGREREIEREGRREGGGD